MCYWIRMVEQAHFPHLPEPQAVSVKEVMAVVIGGQIKQLVHRFSTAIHVRPVP